MESQWGTNTKVGWLKEEKAARRGEAAAVWWGTSRADHNKSTSDQEEFISIKPRLRRSILWQSSSIGPRTKGTTWRPHQGPSW